MNERVSSLLVSSQLLITWLGLGDSLCVCVCFVQIGARFVSTIFMTVCMIAVVKKKQKVHEKNTSFSDLRQIHKRFFLPVLQDTCPYLTLLHLRIDTPTVGFTLILLFYTESSHEQLLVDTLPPNTNYSLLCLKTSASAESRSPHSGN